MSKSSLTPRRVDSWIHSQGLCFAQVSFPAASICRLFVNLETTEKVYKGQEHMCPMDGFVCFHNSELVCGRLGKAALGGGNKSSLFQVALLKRNQEKDPS